MGLPYSPHTKIKEHILSRSMLHVGAKRFSLELPVFIDGKAEVYLNWLCFEFVWVFPLYCISFECLPLWAWLLLSVAIPEFITTHFWIVLMPQSLPVCKTI